MRYKNRSQYNARIESVKCPNCKKSFVPAPYNVYKWQGKDVCTWSCLQALRNKPKDKSVHSLTSTSYHNAVKRTKEMLANRSYSKWGEVGDTVVNGNYKLLLKMLHGEKKFLVQLNDNRAKSIIDGGVIKEIPSQGEWVNMDKPIRFCNYYFNDDSYVSFVVDGKCSKWRNFLLIEPIYINFENIGIIHRKEFKLEEMIGAVCRSETLD